MPKTKNLSDAKPIPVREEKSVRPPRQTSAQIEKIVNKKPILNFNQDTLKVDKHNLPKIWAIRLATFGNKKNAKALEKKLKAKGYSVYVRNKDKRSIVYVGSELQRSQLEKLKIKLKKDFKSLDGIVVHFSEN